MSLHSLSSIPRLAALGAAIFVTGVIGCGEPEVTTTYQYPAKVVPAGAAAAPAAAAASKPFDLVLAGSPSKGPEHAKVTIVESSDFQ